MNTTIFTTLIFGMVGPWQIALIVLAILLLFGGRKIPELMKGLGSGIKEFKKGIKEGDEDEVNKNEQSKQGLK